MPGRRRGRPPHPDLLTPGEQRVLEELRKGGTNAEIAVRLGLSPETVKTHISNMLSKLGLEGRHELVTWRPGGERRGLPALFALPGGLASVGPPLAWTAAGAVALGIAVVVIVLLMPVGGGDPPAPPPTQTNQAPNPQTISSPNELLGPDSYHVYIDSEGFKTVNFVFEVPEGALVRFGYGVPEGDELGTTITLVTPESNTTGLGALRVGPKGELYFLTVGGVLLHGEAILMRDTFESPEHEMLTAIARSVRAGDEDSVGEPVYYGYVTGWPPGRYCFAEWGFEIGIPALPEGQAWDRVETQGDTGDGGIGASTVFEIVDSAGSRTGNAVAFDLATTEPAIYIEGDHYYAVGNNVTYPGNPELTATHKLLDDMALSLRNGCPATARALALARASESSPIPPGTYAYRGHQVTLPPGFTLVSVETYGISTVECPACEEGQDCRCRESYKEEMDFRFTNGCSITLYVTGRNYQMYNPEEACDRDALWDIARALAEAHGFRR